MIESIAPFLIFWLYSIIGFSAILRGKIYFHKKLQLAGAAARGYGAALLLLAGPAVLLVGNVVNQLAYWLLGGLPLNLPPEVIYVIPQVAVLVGMMVGLVIPFRWLKGASAPRTPAPSGWQLARFLTGVAFGLWAFVQAVVLHEFLLLVLDIRTLPGGGTSSVPPEAEPAVFGFFCFTFAGALLGILRSTVFADIRRGQGLWLGAALGLMISFGLTGVIALLTRKNWAIVYCLLGSSGGMVLGAVLGAMKGWYPRLASSESHARTSGSTPPGDIAPHEIPDN